MPKLVVLTVGFNDRSLEVKPEKASIGRVDDNQFCIAEPSVSSHHCEVWSKGDEIVVKVVEIDPQGRVNLTRKGVTPEEAASVGVTQE